MRDEMLLHPIHDSLERMNVGGMIGQCREVIERDEQQTDQNLQHVADLTRCHGADPRATIGDNLHQPVARQQA